VEEVMNLSPPSLYGKIQSLKNTMEQATKIVCPFELQVKVKKVWSGPTFNLDETEMYPAPDYDQETISLQDKVKRPAFILCVKYFIGTHAEAHYDFIFN
jgi:hypothetical protein